ncbi:hypothetical protein MPLA_1800177 [Mesorhizobium sp. ORS 3359]|nr:hypothetical protein MPLA_1800177 [Mesorhizobium sp. ORS 3359]
MVDHHLKIMREIVARRPANIAVHTQLVAGSRECIARSKLLLAITKWQIDMPARPDQPWLPSPGEAGIGAAS